MEIFKERLRECRKRKGKSQEEAAAEMGMPYRSYRRYENGESEPTLSPLKKLAVYYGVTIDFLAGLKDEK